MVSCESCGRALDPSVGLMTEGGLICQSCYDQRSMQAQDMRAAIANKLEKSDNPYGDTTFDPKRRNRAMIHAFVIAALLILTAILKVARLY